MRLIDLDDDRHTYCYDNGEYEIWSIDPEVPCEFQWIPVTERLPLVSYDKYGNHSSDPVIICMESGEVEIGWFNPSGLFERCRSDELDIIGSIADGAVDYMHVVAWMSLPEPYKEDVE